VQDVRGLVEDKLVLIRELDVVGEQDVDVIRLQPLEGGLKRLAGAFRSEVEFRVAESAGLGADVDLLPPPAGERLAEELLRESTAVLRGGINEVHARVDGGVYGRGRFLRGHGAELLPEGGPALREDRDVEAGLA
jgi:hypothetical protein